MPSTFNTDRRTRAASREIANASETAEIRVAPGLLDEATGPNSPACSMIGRIVLRTADAGARRAFAA